MSALSERALSEGAWAHLTQALSFPSPLTPFKLKRTGVARAEGEPDVELLSDLKLWVKRDDLIHPVVSGNKWRKLKGLFEREGGLPPHVVSFGGAHSHHLSALTLALKLWREGGAQVEAHLIIRGDELTSAHNPTLRFCEAQGARLLFVTRDHYQAIRERGWVLSDEERALWGLDEGALVLPEGGAGEHVKAGCAELWGELEAQWGELKERGEVQRELPSQLWLCAGTGATARGLLHAMPQGCPTRLIVVSALKGAKRERAQTLELAQARGVRCEWSDEHSGRFGKLTPALKALRASVMSEAGLWVDPIYQPKLLAELIRRHEALRGVELLWLHTGGARGLEP